MDNIWDGIWSGIDIAERLKRLEKDDLVPIFLKYLPQKGKILEAGCGFAQWVFYFQNKGYDITGIDFAEKTINSVKKFDDKIR